MTHKLFNGAAAAAVLLLSALPAQGLAQTATTSTTGTTTGSTTSSSTTGTATTTVGAGTAIGPTLLPVTSGATSGPGVAGGVTPYQPAGAVGGVFGTGAYQPASALGGGPVIAAPIVETDPSVGAQINYTLQAGEISGGDASSVTDASATAAVRASAGPPAVSAAR